MNLALFILLITTTMFSLYGQQTPRQQVDYVGTWASDNGDSQTVNNAIFVSITYLEDQNRYFVTSVSTASSFLNFVGGGFLREDGFLQVTTDKGGVLLFTPAFSARHREAIAMSIQDIESWNFIRIEEKFDTWPFPVETQK